MGTGSGSEVVTESPLPGEPGWTVGITSGSMSYSLTINGGSGHGAGGWATCSISPPQATWGGQEHPQRQVPEGHASQVTPVIGNELGNGPTFVECGQWDIQADVPNADWSFGTVELSRPGGQRVTAQDACGGTASLTVTVTPGR